jgi:uncharacterized repeat protein (TIGR04076 family)
MCSQEMREGEYKIVATVVKQEGTCVAGYEVGDELVFEAENIEGKLCIHALYSMLPKVFAMRYGAQFPWQEDVDVALHACPDALNPLTFEIRRVRE